MSNAKNIDGNDFTYSEALDYLWSHIEDFKRYGVLQFKVDWVKGFAEEMMDAFPTEFAAAEKRTGCKWTPETWGKSSRGAA